MIENNTCPSFMIYSIPESMIRLYGNYTTTATFKIFHNGETFQLPHYNLDVSEYCELYINYLKNLINTNLKMKIFHIDDIEKKLNLSNSDILQGKINEFIFDRFNSRIYVFYIIIENTKYYDIERSLITNSTFEEECNICYQETSLKHYYNCDLGDKTNHHGICGNCYMSWQSANPENNCPICRAHKNNQ